MKYKGLLGSLAAVALISGLYLIVSGRSIPTDRNGLRNTPNSYGKPTSHRQITAPKDDPQASGPKVNRDAGHQNKTGKDNMTMMKENPSVLKPADMPEAISRGQTVPSEKEVPPNLAEPLLLWDTPDASWKNPDVPAEPLPPNIQARDIRVVPEALELLQMGQHLALPIPQEDHTYYGVIEESRVQLDGKVHVWSGRILGGDGLTSFTISQGETATRVMIATEESVYQVRMNKNSIWGSVIDERQFDRFHNPYDAMAWDTGG